MGTDAGVLPGKPELTQDSQAVEGRVEALFIVGRRGDPPHPVDRVEALAAIGLAGDRYGVLRLPPRFRRCQVTLIEAEHLAASGEAAGEAVLAPGVHRRNIVTRGIRLATLVGCRARIGDAIVLYDRRRPPCRRLDALAGRPIARSLAGWGGICVQVIESGPIRIGDAITPLPPGDG